MKSLNLFLACTFILIGIHASAQFTLSNFQPCEGDTIKVFELNPTSNNYCVGTSPNYIPTTYYKYHIDYYSNYYTVIGGTPLETLTTESSIRIRAYPASYTLPVTMLIRVQKFKGRNDGSGITDMCSEETLFVTPRKKMAFNGPTVLDDPAIAFYYVTNVQEGVNFTWHLNHPNWSIANSNSNHSNVSLSIDPTAGPGPFQLSVTADPEINACGWPSSKMISIAPCYFQGVTQYNFCIPQTNWGDILATTDFKDYPIKYPRMVGDFNGDNKDDLIGFGHSGVIVGLSTGSNFNYNTWTSVFTNGNGGYNQTERPRMIGDFDGDGKDDIVGFGYSSTAVALSNGYSFTTSGFASTSAFSYQEGFTNVHLPRFVGDFNGDGKTDIMGCGHNTTSVGLSNGTSFDVAGWSGGETFSSTYGGFAGDPNDNDPDALEDTQKYPRMVGDFNGDGKTDIIGFGHTDVSVGLSTGSSFDVSTWTHAFTYGNEGVNQKYTPRGIGDFNGDGKDDIILFDVNAVKVGISNGTNGFVISTWTTNDFTDNQYWSTRHIDPLESGHKVLIYDVNGDGKDDLVGFNDGVYVAYSDGGRFQCADHDPDKLEFGGYSVIDYGEARFMGNFDNRDDEAEFVALHANNIEVMDCETCFTSVANASMMRHYAVATETSGSNSVSVYKYCIEDSVGMDLSAAHCEDSYYLEIKPYNLSTGTAGTAVYQTGWIPRNAPKKVDFSALNLPTNQLYQVTFGVGPNTSTKTLYFRITGPVANLTITPNQTRTVTNNFGTFTINQYCTNVVSFSLNGTASNCYDEYRYSIFEVAAPFFVPAYGVPPVLQIPASGGWNPGPVATQNINMSNIVSGKVYKIILYVRKNGVTSTYERLVERNSCIAPPPKSLVIDQGTESLSEPTSILYPNPMTNYIIVNPAGYDEEEITGDIYDAYGKLVGSTILESGKDNTIELLHVSPGIYLIVLQGNNRNEKLSFIKQ